jgi:outer membrane lipoprotein
LTTASIILALSACTAIPEQIQGTYPEITPVRVGPSVFGSDVRWGGVIVGSSANDKQSCLEILSHELDKYLRPKRQDSTGGRFIACQSSFLDPMVFAPGREITVTGNIKNIEIRKVEDFDYRYPVLQVEDLVLWQKRRVVMRYRGFNDPFYNPWYGRGAYWGGYWGGYGNRWGSPYGPYSPYSSGYLEPRELLPGPAIIETSEQ